MSEKIDYSTIVQKGLSSNLKRKSNEDYEKELFQESGIVLPENYEMIISELPPDESYGEPKYSNILLFKIPFDIYLKGKDVYLYDCTHEDDSK